MFEKWRRPGRSPKEGKIKKLFNYIVFGAICLVFVFLAPMGTKLMGEGVVAYVGGEPIRGRDLSFIEENIRRSQQGRLEQANEENYLKIQEEIRQSALRQIIELFLMAQGSQKEGFFLSDEELRAEIRSFPAFQQEGRFLYSAYLTFLKNSKLSSHRFEERIKKSKLSENWINIFKKASLVNSLEEEKKSQRGRYKVNFRYVLFKAGDIEEQKLEPLVKAGDVKKVNHFVQKNKGVWEKTGLFSLFSPFGTPIAQNQNLMELLIRHLPSLGIIPQLIRQADKIYVVDVLSFKEGEMDAEEKQLEKLISQRFDKSTRLLDSWLNFQREKIKVKL